MFCAATLPVVAQNDFNTINEDGQITTASQHRISSDSLGSDKEIPKGLKVWTVDERFGDRIVAEIDTMPYMYMNTTFTSGLRGEYNTLGNMGSPRINRIFIDRKNDNYNQFVFAEPFDFFIKPVGDFHFTNTYSPITNITFNSCGDRTNGEDDFKATFAVNANKRLGGGFMFDYKYGRGYYDSQSTSHFGYNMWLSYLGDRYNAHFLFTTNHEKVTENGGITNTDYIKHPELFNESFQTNEIPTVLAQNWNRHDNQHIFFSHRYNIGFNRKVPMTEEEKKAKKFALDSKKDNDAEKAKEEARKKAKKEGRKFDENAFDKNAKKPQFSGRPDNAKIAGGTEPADNEKNGSDRISINGKAQADSLSAATKQQEEENMWMKNEYVPVTSIIHTLKFDNYQRIYQAYQTPQDYYLNEYYTIGKFGGDSIYDKTKHWALKNTIALATLEGFSKWAKAGLKAFASYDIQHFTLPDSLGGTNSYNEHTLSVGGQLSKQQGKTLHYNAIAEIGVAGENAGCLWVDGNFDINIPFLKDTLTLRGDAFFHRENPKFYYRNYHSRHFWWDNELDKITHTRIMGTLTYPKTNTTLRIAFDEITNHAYLSQSYGTTSDGRNGVFVTPMQCADGITLFTAQLMQNFHFGILHWENVLTYQTSSKQEVIPVPDLNIYTNLFLRFRIAKVLSCDFGADARYFTEYEAPDYSPALGQYAVQGNGENNVKIGNYPIVNVYANLHIKHTRFFVMMSHVNAGSGDKNYFLTPYYPLNQRVFRFGVSWNFFN